MKQARIFLANITDIWKCKYQLVPLDMHRRNAVEQTIWTAKAHFLSILAGVDPGFQKSRWDLLLPQTELTLNLLRQARYNPKILAWECINLPYTFDAKPMGPPRCRVIAHAKCTMHWLWDCRRKVGYYVGPSLIH